MSLTTGVIGIVSMLLLTIAWRWWQDLDIGGDHVVAQGVLLAVVTAGWFLRVVLGVVK